MAWEGMAHFFRSDGGAPSAASVDRWMHFRLRERSWGQRPLGLQGFMLKPRGMGHHERYDSVVTAHVAAMVQQILSVVPHITSHMGFLPDALSNRTLPALSPVDEAIYVISVGTRDRRSRSSSTFRAKSHARGETFANTEITDMYTAEAIRKHATSTKTTPNSAMHRSDR